MDSAPATRPRRARASPAKRRGSTRSEPVHPVANSGTRTLNASKRRQCAICAFCILGVNRVNITHPSRTVPRNIRTTPPLGHTLTGSTRPSGHRSYSPGAVTPRETTSADVLIVGAGLSGLTCARVLHAHGISVRVFERQSRPGGRVQTDDVEGFRLDRGFQVLLTSYPEIHRHLDLDALDLRAFTPGARVWNGQRFELLGDPLRTPRATLPTLFARAATVGDKLRMLRLRRRVCARGPYEAFTNPEQTTRAFLESEGFSARCIEQFFVPFLGGVFLESALETSSRFFEFVFAMFAQGDATVPARGMGEISNQLAANLPAGALVYGTSVVEVHDGGVTEEDGARHNARHVVIACEASAARALVPTLDERPRRSVSCLYFDAPHAPTDEPILHLRGSEAGPINNLHAASTLSEHLAPPDRALISASCLGHHPDTDALLAPARAQLRRWFGGAVESWRLLRHERIDDALPAQPQGTPFPAQSFRRTEGGLFICGDHCAHASIDGAMRSGRHTAEAIIAERARARSGDGDS